MLENEIKKYFDGIEPDNELIERMITMSENTNNGKIVKFSKRAVALIVAAVILIVGTSVTAAVVRMKNDNNGIVQLNNDESFLLEFSKAERSPEKLSDTSNAIVKSILEKGINDVVIPTALISEGYEINSIIDFIPQYKSVMLDLSNNTDNSVSMSIIQDISDEDIDSFWGTGDEDSTGEVVSVNGMDVVIVYMGDNYLGYTSFIFYANGNTIYQLSYFAGLNEAQARQNTLDFVNTLAQ